MLVMLQNQNLFHYVHATLGREEREEREEKSDKRERRERETGESERERGE